MIGYVVPGTNNLPRAHNQTPAYRLSAGFHNPGIGRVQLLIDSP